MTKAELIENLKNYPDDMEVVIQPISCREHRNHIDFVSKIKINQYSEGEVIVLQTKDPKLGML